MASESSEDVPLAQKIGQKIAEQPQVAAASAARAKVQNGAKAVNVDTEGKNGCAGASGQDSGSQLQPGVQEVKKAAPGIGDSRVSRASESAGHMANTKGKSSKADTKKGTNEKPGVRVVVAERAKAGKGAGDGADGATVSKPKAKVAKPKAVYDLPGQTRPSPAPDDPLYKFYTSLRDQRPESAMAAKWCVQHGVLSRDEAEAWLAANGKSIASPSKKAATKPAAKAAREGPTKQTGSSKAPTSRARSSADAAGNGTGKPRQKQKAAAKKRKSRDVAFEDSDDADLGDKSEDEAAPPVSKRAKMPVKAPLASGDRAVQGGAVDDDGADRKERKVHDDGADREELKVGENGTVQARRPPAIGPAASESDEDDLPLAQRKALAHA